MKALRGQRERPLHEAVTSVPGCNETPGMLEMLSYEASAKEHFRQGLEPCPKERCMFQVARWVGGYAI